MGCVILAWLGPVEPRCCHWLSLLSVTVVDIFWVFSDLLLLVPFASPAFDLAFPRKYSPWVWTLISRFFFTAPLCVGSERGVCLQWVLPFLGHILPRELSHHWASYLGTYPLLAFSLHVSVYTRSYWLVDWLYVCACCWGSAQGLVLVRPGLCHIVIPQLHICIYNFILSFVNDMAVLSIPFERMNARLYEFILWICWVCWGMRDWVAAFYL